MQTIRAAVLLISLLGIGVTGVFAQQFDYEKFPQLDVELLSLDAEVRLDAENNAIRGNVDYTLRTRRAGVDSLVLNAAHMEIENATVFGEEADFHLHNDSLFISLSDSSALDEEFEVSVSYNTTPQFGVLKNENGTLWSSTLPGSVRHWLPVIDHPRVTVTSRMRIAVPSGYSVVATGRLTGEEIVNVDYQAFTFETEEPVPASALSFAAGSFDVVESTSGQMPVNLAVEDVITGIDGTSLLATAEGVIDEIEQSFGVSFPFQELNIVLVSDHFWETKSWGASTVFLYENAGNIEAQLRRGIYAQWLGIHQREEQWSEARALNVLQTALHYQLAESPARIKSSDRPETTSSTLYDIFTISTWNSWQQNFPTVNSNWQRTVNESLEAVLQWPAGVYSFTDYATYWYEQSGQPRFELPSPDTEGDESSAGLDTVLYRVDYDLNEEDGEMKLTFTAEQGSYDELVTLPLTVVTRGETSRSDITFTGTADSVIVNVPVFVETVHLDASGREKLVLDEFKPVPFLIYEIRNAESSGQQAEAARKLSHYADNPDLGLAVRDILTRDLDSEVEAALLRSLAEITDGASGTEQVFLDRLDSDERDVQLAALSALQNYRQSESVLSAVRDFAADADSISTFRNAAGILAGLAGVDQFKTFTNTVVQSDTAGHKAVYTIQQLANMGETDQAVRLADFYIENVYEYQVRASALGILIQHDNTPEDWRTRAEQLLADLDPRIRFLTVKGLSNISGLDTRDILREYMLDEYDARVHQQMQTLLEAE